MAHCWALKQQARLPVAGFVLVVGVGSGLFWLPRMAYATGGSDLCSLSGVRVGLWWWV